MHTVDELMTLDDGDHVFVASKGEEHSGSVCLQAYKIGHKLGQGGFGSVYAALDRGTKEDVAIKFLKINNADTLRFIDKEARAL